jgi:hypothetical protein
LYRAILFVKIMKALVSLLLPVVLFSACSNSSTKQTSCGSQACTDIFESIDISYTNSSGAPLMVKGFSVIDTRTNTAIKESGDIITNPGTYVVVHDSYLKNLSADGDNLQVSATDSLTNQTKTTIIKVSGGQCACHVTKISGADTVAFN